MLKARIAVLVSGSGTNLSALIKARENILKDGEIVLVIADRKDCYALVRAGEADIDNICLNRKELGAQLFEEKVLNLLEEKEIDFIILAGFLSILSASFITSFKKPIINIHPSLIPSFCGKGMYGIHVHEAALKRGVKISGATVHYVNEIPDGGKILMQKAVEVKDEDTPSSLQLRIMKEAEWYLLPRAAQKIAKELIDAKK